MDNRICLMKEDCQFLQNKLSKISPELHKSILSDYYKEWCKGMEDSIAPYQAQNRGRKRANLWIHER